MKKTVNKSLKSWLPMLCIALVGFACSFVVASFAWFADNENSTATVIVSDEVNIELTGTGEHGAILGFSDFASNTMSSAAVPGDTLTDAISVTIPASTSKSVLRLKYHVTIMENSTTVKEVTTNEEEIFKALLEKSFSDQTIGDASNDWTTNIESEDKWLYYQTLVGESDPNDMVVPVSSSLVFPLDMGSEFENIRFKVGVEAEAMQAGNFDQINDWEHDVRLLDSTVLWQRIVNYNASRGVSLINNIQRFIPYIVSTGTQWIDTNFRVENENVAYSLLASISSTSLESCSMFGSETYGNASSVPVGHDNNRIFAGVPYGGYDGTRLQYSMFYGGGDNGSVDFEIGQKFNLEIESVNNGSADTVTVKKNGETQISSSVPSVVTHGSVFLFNNGKPDGASTNQQIAGMQVYCFRIFEDGELVRELYPALDNFSVPCMYDMVEDVIYYNAGSGSFICTTQSPIT